MKTRDDFITNLLAAEGGYVNDPRDSGGEKNKAFVYGWVKARRVTHQQTVRK
jgi:lysozyme family protein